MTPPQARYRAVWAYPWDLARPGAARRLRAARDAGANTVSVAAVYHSLWALDPHGRGHWFLAPRSGLYIRPRDPMLRRAAAPLLAGYRPAWDVGRARAATEAAGLGFTAWLVLCHSSLAAARPSLAVRLPGGMRHPGALCPANARVADYLERLLVDMSSTLAPRALDLEAVGWVPAPHHLHAKIGQPLGPLGRYLLSLCTCRACWGDEARAIASLADRLIEEQLDDPDFSPLAEALAEHPQLAELQRRREDVVAGLLRRLRAAVDVPLHVVHWDDFDAVGLSPAAVVDAGCTLTVLAYSPSPATVKARLGEAVAAASAERIVAGLSACAPDCDRPAGLRRHGKVLRQLGIRSFSLYNMSLVREERLLAALHHLGSGVGPA